MRGKRIAVLVASALAVLLVLVGVFRNPPPGVRVALVKRGVVEHLVTSVSSGTLDAKRSLPVSTLAGGRVLDILKREGDPVAEGEAVLVLDAEELSEQAANERLGLDSARARLREAMLRRDQAGADYRRAWELWKEGVFSRKQAESANTAWELAKAEVEAVRTNIQKLESSIGALDRRLAETELASPFAGVVKAIHAERGTYLVPRQPAFEVIDPSELEIVALMDEVDARLLEAGQEVRITADALPGATFEGHVTWVAPVVDVNKRMSRGVEIEVARSESPPELRIGMSVDVDVLVGRAADTLWVPSRAVTEVEGEPAVYVVEGRRGRIELRRIEQGIYTFTRVEVLAGLEEGEQVVLNTEDVKPGTKVRVEAVEEET